jgi:WD40 repeat protein
LTTYPDGAGCVALSTDGKRLLTSHEITLRLWDADTGKLLNVFEGHTDRIQGAVLSPDGQRVLSGGNDRTVRLWDAETGKELRRMTGHSNDVCSVAFGPAGKAVSTSNDGTMRMWDLTTGKETGEFVFTEGTSKVTYSDKAKLAATSIANQPIQLRDLETGKVVRKLTCQSGILDWVSVCFSADGKRVVAASNDHTVRFWDMETGKELKRIDVANAHSAALSPDGKHIVCGEISAVRVFDVATGKELRLYNGHTGSVASVAFFPDSERIASASGDGARTWRVPR